MNQLLKACVQQNERYVFKIMMIPLQHDFKYSIDKESILTTIVFFRYWSWLAR